MSESIGYWARRAISRRSALRGAAAAGTGIAALSFVGCGGGSSGSKTPTVTTPAATGQALDSTKGKPGGKFVRQYQTVPSTMELVRIVNGNAATLAGYTHSGLLEFRNGRPGDNAHDIAVDADLAQALPEQPDELTYVFKLKDAKFHNGRAVTSEDVKYSFDRYGLSEQSAYRTIWSWYDKSEAPDPKTVVIKTKAPFADGLTSLAQRTDAFILAKEHEESPDVDKKLVGSGPYTFVDMTPPVSVRFKKNPDYYQKPYPYFDEIEVLGTSDVAKRIADYVSGQVHLTYRFAEEERDQIKKGRSDVAMWAHESGSYWLVLRADQPPFNDKRVRQALSMSIDRKAIREAVSKGEHESDQVLSYTVKAWNFRKPADLGAAAKYWTLDPQAAKQLLSAAGLTLPIQMSMTHNDESFLGPTFVNTGVLTQAQWRNAGVANVKDVSIPPSQSTTTTSVGNYDDSFVSANSIFNNPIFGVNLRAGFYSPPEGVKSPTQNVGHVNDQQLSQLVDKQLTQLKTDDRRQTLRQVEDLIAEEQYRLAYSSNGNFYFADPNIRNIEIPKWVFAGSHSYTKYWWFDKA